jgi:hypothetical protein
MDARRKPFGKNDAMDRPGQAEKVGRTLLIGAMVAGLAFEVLQPVFTMLTSGGTLFDNQFFFMSLAVGLLFRLSLVILLFVETFQGRNWARWTLGGLYLVSAVSRYYPMVGVPATEIDALDVAAVAVFLALGVLVLAAAPIRAFQAAVREKKGR